MSRSVTNTAKLESTVWGRKSLAGEQTQGQKRMRMLVQLINTTNQQKPTEPLCSSSKLWTIICFHVDSVYNQSLLNHFHFLLYCLSHFQFYKFKNQKINWMSIHGGYKLLRVDLVSSVQPGLSHKTKESLKEVLNTQNWSQTQLPSLMSLPEAAGQNYISQAASVLEPPVCHELTGRFKVLLTQTEKVTETQ